jgi:hypothetical protein
MLIVLRWNLDVVTRAIRDVCVRTEGADWWAVLRGLTRYGEIIHAEVGMR